MEASRRKSKGTIRRIKETRWPIHPMNKVCCEDGRRSYSSASSVNVMKDLGTLNYQQPDSESEASTTTTIFLLFFFDFLVGDSVVSSSN